MPPYDGSNFDPPAPVALVEIVGPSGRQVGVRVLLDSGADASILPRTVVEAVGGAVTASGYELESFDGTRVAAPETRLTVRLAPFRFDGAYLIADQEYGVLGRNVLRHLVLRRDGPRQTWGLVR